MSSNSVVMDVTARWMMWPEDYAEPTWCATRRTDRVEPLPRERGVRGSVVDEGPAEYVPEERLRGPQVPGPGTRRN